MVKRRENSQASDRTRAMIRNARVAAIKPDSAPAVAHVLLTQQWDTIASDEEVLRHLVAAGLNAKIRQFLTQHFSGEDGIGARQARAQQLRMWPQDRRALVEQVDRERVWVPSREEFVEFVPDALSVPEMREAGEYLIGQGADCIRRGRNIKRLADMEDGAASDAA